MALVWSNAIKRAPKSIADEFFLHIIQLRRVSIHESNCAAKTAEKSESISDLILFGKDK